MAKLSTENASIHRGQKCDQKVLRFLLLCKRMGSWKATSVKTFLSGAWINFMALDKIRTIKVLRVINGSTGRCTMRACLAQGMEGFSRIGIHISSRLGDPHWLIRVLVCLHVKTAYERSSSSTALCELCCGLRRKRSMFWAAHVSEKNLGCPPTLARKFAHGKQP